MASERMQRRIERLLDQIDQAEAQGEWQSVHSLAQDVLEVDPGNGDATVYLRSAERRLAAALEIAGFSSASPTAVEPTATAPDAERRQLTVMFCDLQGSTALSQQLDPEVLRDVIRSYQEVCAGAVSKFDGHIAKYLGDGLLIYFGYPQAHEDDPQRAVRAGLAILQDMNPLNVRLKTDKDLELTVRIGIHTGLVVAGEMGGGDTLEELAIVGETPNIAARIEGAALPNSVVVSDITANLIQGLFLYEPLGPHELKGISEPVELFRVLQESAVQTRFEVAAAAELTPIVGRQQEVGLVMDRWEQVEEGLGQIVLISGEAGIGKSRLLQEIYERLAGRSHQIREYRCSPYHQNSALFPVIDFTEKLLQFRKEDTSEQRLDKLEGALQDFGIPVTESVPLMAEMLSVPLGDRYPPLNLSPQRQRQDTLELLSELAIENSTRGKTPMLVVFVDLHWADPTTLEMISLWLDRFVAARSLTIYTFRPEFVPPWGSRSHLTQITLSRLPRRLTTDMMSGLTGGKEIPEEVVTQIAAKSDGVPLFVEELTRMVVESGLLREVDGRYELDGPLPALAIPSTLQDSLTARLDRLSSVRESVQLAAVLGREFSYELIGAVSPLEDVNLGQQLEELVTSEFLYQRGIPPKSTYTFRQALIQDAAYNSLLISRRQQYHQRVAEVLEERFPDTVEVQPELVAHHYTEAGCNQQAVNYWQRAGQNAMSRSANVEAVNHVTKGLGLLEALPDTPERAAQEVILQTMLGRTYLQIRGYSAPEVQLAFNRARDLIDQTGESAQHFHVMTGLHGYYWIRGQHRSALTISEQLLEIAQNGQDSDQIRDAHCRNGNGLMWLGDLSLAEDQLTQAIAQHDVERRRDLALEYGVEPSGSAYTWLGTAKWLLGYPDQASNHIREGLRLAEELAHPFSQAFALGVSATFYCRSRATREANECLDKLFPLAEEQQFNMWTSHATSMRGVTRIQSGNRSEGIEALIKELDRAKSIGVAQSRAYQLSLLAEAQGAAGETGHGLETLEQALAHVEESDERLAEADIHRIKGDLLLLSGESDERAEECYHQSLDVARRQSAKSWELRTTISLARLWQKQGKNKEARELLAGIYGWFTEGFGTPDLMDAKALLEELS